MHFYCAIVIHGREHMVASIDLLHDTSSACASRTSFCARANRRNKQAYEMRLFLCVFIGRPADERVGLNTSIFKRRVTVRDSIAIGLP